MELYAIVRPKKPDYIHGKPHKVFNNKLAQNFTAERANQKTHHFIISNANRRLFTPDKSFFLQRNFCIVKFLITHMHCFTQLSVMDTVGLPSAVLETGNVDEKVNLFTCKPRSYHFANHGVFQFLHDIRSPFLRFSCRFIYFYIGLCRFLFFFICFYIFGLQLQ